MRIRHKSKVELTFCDKMENDLWVQFFRWDDGLVTVQCSSRVVRIGLTPRNIKSLSLWIERFEK